VFGGGGGGGGGEDKAGKGWVNRVGFGLLGCFEE